MSFERLCEEYMAKEARLLELCQQISAAFRIAGNDEWRDVFSSIATRLRTAPDSESKQEIATQLVRLFHRDGIFDDVPAGLHDSFLLDEWRNISSELLDLALIFRESKYTEVRKSIERCSSET